MKTINYLFGILLVSFLSSCINEKYIYQHNRIYKIESVAAEPQDSTPTSETNKLIVHSPNKGFKAIISDKGDYLTIKPDDEKKFSSNTATITLKKPLTGWRAEIVEKYYFPETDNDNLAKVPYKLSYFDTKPVIQALTIPLKIRPALNDSYPSQAETSFNVGAAFGWKFTHNVYDSRKNIFGQNTNRYSISPGIFLGTGATDLKKTNTDPSIAIERKAAIITTGGFVMVGFNSINFGYAFGGDFATGTGSKDWLYQGKMWHGIIFAIDIIK